MTAAQPPFGPSPAPLAGKELPSFRYPLGAQPVKTYPGGASKEANVETFPVSETLAGVVMHLAPGGLRELHWPMPPNGPMSSPAAAG